MSFDPSRAIFSQVDTNRDGNIDQGEFSQFLGGGGGFGGSSSYESSQYSSGGLSGASGYESSSFSSGGYGGEAAFAGGAGGFGESSSYESSASFGAGAGAGAGFGESSSYEASASYGAGAGGAVGFAAGAGAQGYDASSFSSQTNVQTYATDAQGLFKDPNPQIIRRAAAGGVQTYTQNIRVRFLQPPPIPPPGPLIIKEVRPPQPPPPPPLRVRQQAPPLPQLPPLILRERPPRPPAVTASQTVIRRLGAIPVPPRSVIIERLPPLPPRPRDIVIERWIPYGAQAKRRTIVQRAGAAAQYARPRNVIIQYEAAQVRIVRQFQRLGVVQANPQAYLQQYGAQLLEASALVQQARSAGVVEDISAPAVASSVGFSAASYGQEAGGFSSSGNFASSSNSIGGDSGFAYEGGSAGGASAFESSGYGGEASAGFGGGFESSSSSSFESSSYGGGGAAGGGGFDAAGAAFRSVDVNNDGSIDRGEFNRFFQQGI